MKTTTPMDPSFYPTTMSCKGLTITNTVAAAAYKAWQNEGVRSGYMRLTSHIEIAHKAATGSPLGGHPHDRYELAYRIMQRARKAGFIEATGDRSKPWRRVEQPEAEIEGPRP